MSKSGKKSNEIQEAGTIVGQMEKVFQTSFTTRSTSISTNNFLMDVQSSKESDEDSRTRQKIGDESTVKSLTSIADKPGDNHMGDSMESDDEKGGSISINWKDSARDWCEKKAAECRESEENQGIGRSFGMGN